jgi:hypothetical protein
MYIGNSKASAITAHCLEPRAPLFYSTVPSEPNPVLDERVIKKSNFVSAAATGDDDDDEEEPNQSKQRGLVLKACTGPQTAAGGGWETGLRREGEVHFFKVTGHAVSNECCRGELAERSVFLQPTWVCSFVLG